MQVVIWRLLLQCKIRKSLIDKESYYYFQKEYIDQSNNIDKTIAEDINLLCFKDKSFYEDNSKNYHNALEGLKSQIEKNEYNFR